MFIDNHKETEIKLESYRLKLWYYHVVMTTFFSDVLIHFKWIKYNNKMKLKNEYYLLNRHFTPYLFYINLKTRWSVDSFWIV